MAIGDTWKRALEYFGLVDGDYIEEGQYTDEHELEGEDATMGDDAGPIREPARDTGPRRRRARQDVMGDVDDIFGDDEPPRRGGRAGTATPPPDLAPVEPMGNGGANVQMKLVAPRNFNDAQQVADEFKASRPVILNLQDTGTDLARRLIDFCSGLTYAMGGGMQKIANQTFLLTPRNVQVSAAEAERMLERGFFNQE